MKTRVSTKSLKKKNRMDTKTKPNSKIKWFNRVKGISSATGDEHPIKVNIFGATYFSTSNNQTTQTNDYNSYPRTGATSGLTYIGVQEQKIFVSKANRVKLDSSDQG